MTIKEKRKDELLNWLLKRVKFAIDKDTGEFMQCFSANIERCLFAQNKRCTFDCVQLRNEWLNSEYKGHVIDEGIEQKTNWENDKETILKLIASGNTFGVHRKTGEVNPCKTLDCPQCLFYSSKECAEARYEWFDEKRIEPKFDCDT